MTQNLLHKVSVEGQCPKQIRHDAKNPSQEMIVAARRTSVRDQKNCHKIFFRTNALGTPVILLNFVIQSMYSVPVLQVEKAQSEELDKPNVHIPVSSLSDLQASPTDTVLTDGRLC